MTPQNGRREGAEMAEGNEKPSTQGSLNAV